MPIPLIPIIIGGAAGWLAGNWFKNRKRTPGPRAHFSDEQIAIAAERQEGRCPCCGESLDNVDWDAHHADGDRSNDRTNNCVLACVDCHRRCYHRKGTRVKPSMPDVCNVTGAS